MPVTDQAPEKILQATVSVWIEQLRSGDDHSAEHLWQRYFQQLVRLAERRLPLQARRSFDEEDVALSAFHSLCEGVRGGRFPELSHREDLWSLLVVITARKARARLRAESAEKRGGSAAPVEVELSNILGTEPTPEFAAELVDESERLLALLDDDDLRSIAIRKLEGYQNKEIAEEMGCALRTIERRLALIRQAWSELEP